MGPLLPKLSEIITNIASLHYFVFDDLKLALIRAGRRSKLVAYLLHRILSRSVCFSKQQMKKSHLPSSPFKPNQRPITSPIIRSAKPSANGQGRLSVFQTSQAITQGQLVSRVPLSASARHSDSVSFQVSPQNSGYINSSAMDNFGPAPDICYERSSHSYYTLEPIVLFLVIYFRFFVHHSNNSSNRISSSIFRTSAAKAENKFFVVKPTYYISEHMEAFNIYIYICICMSFILIYAILFADV